MTITEHKLLVMKYCFEVGLYKQGILHDLSKYTPAEFLVGCKYYQGNRSPNNAEREATGLSSAWLHHKGRNKHHYEYWIDYKIDTDKKVIMAGMRMPKNYVIEMFLDRIAACKIYEGKNYTNKSPLNYYEAGKSCMIIHPESQKLLESLLKMLADKGERKVFAYIKNLKRKKKL